MKLRCTRCGYKGSIARDLDLDVHVICCPNCILNWTVGLQLLKAERRNSVRDGTDIRDINRKVQSQLLLTISPSGGREPRLDQKGAKIMNTKAKREADGVEMEAQYVFAGQSHPVSGLCFRKEHEAYMDLLEAAKAARDRYDAGIVAADWLPDSPLRKAIAKAEGG